MFLFEEFVLLFQLFKAVSSEKLKVKVDFWFNVNTQKEPQNQKFGLTMIKPPPPPPLKKTDQSIEQNKNQEKEKDEYHMWSKLHQMDSEP